MVVRNDMVTWIPADTEAEKDTKFHIKILKK